MLAWVVVTRDLLKMSSKIETQHILNHFLQDQYPQIICEKCMLTFLTTVYDVDDTHVLLEKRSLGLEYFCEAIHLLKLTKTPTTLRVGIIDEDGMIVSAPPSKTAIFSGEETDYRYLYLLEKLQHLGEEDTQFFNQCVKDMDWKSETQRETILNAVKIRYDEVLAQEISALYQFYTQHQKVLAWDLHGDNLMRRNDSNEIVVIDPYTRKI